MSTGSLAQKPPTEIPAPHPKVIRFGELCDEMKEVHRRKSWDYSTHEDPHSNFNRSRNFHIDPFVGLMLRLSDKVARIEAFVTKGNLMNESVADALRDIAVYANIGRVMLEDGRPNLGPK